MSNSENHISIEGNNNLVIQGVDNSTIRIDITNSELLSNFLKETNADILKSIDNYFKYLPKNNEINLLLSEINKELTGRTINQQSSGSGNNINAETVTINNYNDKSVDVRKNFKLFFALTISFLKANIKLEIGILSILLIVTPVFLFRNEIKNADLNNNDEFTPVCCGEKNKIYYGNHKNVEIIESISIIGNRSKQDSIKICKELEIIFKLQLQLEMLRKANNVDVSIVKSTNFEGTVSETLSLLNSIQISMRNEINEYNKTKWNIGDTIPEIYFDELIQKHNYFVGKYCKHRDCKIENFYEYFRIFGNDNLVAVIFNDTIGFVNSERIVKISFIFENDKCIDREYEYFYDRHEHHYWHKYDYKYFSHLCESYYFNYYYSIVKKNKKYGIIDTTGNFIIQPIYESFERYGNNIELSNNDSINNKRLIFDTETKKSVIK